MAKNSFLDWDTTASNNTDVAGIGIQGTNLPSNFDNALRTIMAQLRSGVDGEVVYATKSAGYTAVANDNNAFIRFTAAATLSLTAAATLGANWHVLVVADGGDVTIDPNSTETIDGRTTLTVRNGSSVLVICDGTNFKTNLAAETTAKGHIHGLTISNNATDATNDIDIAAGEAASDGSVPYLLRLTSGITKRLDAGWSVGTGQGGLDTGAAANGTYHVWLIQRSDTGVVDVLFSTSATSPTMPTNYDRKRRIGSIIRSAGAILAFQQFGDKFTFSVPIADVGVNNPGTSAVTATMTVPTGIVVTLNGYARLQTSTTSATFVAYVSALAQSDEAPTATIATVILQSDSDAGTKRDIGFFAVETNTSAQIRYRMGTSDTNTSITIVTHGWVDTRGRLA